MKEFYTLLRPYTRNLLGALGAIFVSNGAALAFPWGLKLLIDEVASKNNVRLLHPVIFALIAAAFLKFSFGYLRESILVSVGERCISDIRNSLYIHLKRLSVSYVDATPHGEIISRIIGDTDRIRDFLFGGVVDFVYSFLNIFFILTILTLLNPKLMFVSLLCIPPLYLVFVKLTPRLRRSHEQLRTHYADLTGILYETCQGMRVISGFGRQEEAIRQFKEKQSGVFSLSCVSQKLAILLWLNAELLSSLGLILIIWFGIKEVVAGKITIGTLMAFYSYTGMLFYPIVKMVHINNDYQEAYVALARINRFRAVEPNVKTAYNPIIKNDLQGRIEFSDVSFGYHPGTPVLHHITLNITPGETIALVGPSGAGKTTLINLLLRFWDPWSGAIYIDGDNLKTLDLTVYRRKIAMVLQDDYLFNATIRENLAYACPEASFTQVRQAAEKAYAAEFIEKFPQKYDTIIGENGIALSYGQRQRISIARAMLRDPAILILDEATSNIDSESEREILKRSYQTLIAGRTALIIAHRLSTIEKAGRILVIEEGKIVEQGTHITLLAKRGRYWQMWQTQHPAGQNERPHQLNRT
ncbi:MAG: ABC transporter ATP-binding protein [Candidatus Omnitrophica bacterium]|nr:ABC transporter ATP-binding protein [Candidatus Omnitrophota bacterium]